MLKTEFTRAFMGYPFWISLSIGSVICIAHIFLVVIPEYQAFLAFPGIMPTSAFGRWIGIWSSSSLDYAYYFILPILATLPYGWSLYDDHKTGYAMHITTRTSKLSYLSSKACAVFIAGGIACTIPLIINFLGTACVLPLFQPDPLAAGSFMIYPIDWQASLFFDNAFAYTALFFLITFITMGFVACSGLAFGCLLPSKTLTLLAPFLVCTMFSQIFTHTALYSIVPTNLIRAGQVFGPLVPCHALIFFVGTSILIVAILIWHAQKD